MKKYLFVIVALCCMCFTSCKENFSNGERVGTVTKFSKAGVIWDSWDGHLNITQTGMNSAGEPFSFSLDNDRSDQDSIIRELINAQRYGWKIKIKYHQVWGFKNFYNNRGESDYFVDGIEILDKNFAHPLEDVGQSGQKAIKGLLGSKENPIHIVIDNK
jgi:hypothetical protein